MRATAGRVNDVQIAEQVGVSASTIGRWRSGEIDPKPRQVVAFARAYGADPLVALVAAGYLDRDSLGERVTIAVPTDLDDVSTSALIEEVQRRLELVGDYVNWIHAIVEDRPSPARLTPRAMRYIDPNRPPRDVRGQNFVDILADHLVTDNPDTTTDDDEFETVTNYDNSGALRRNPLDEGTVVDLFGVRGSREDLPAAARKRDADSGEDTDAP